MYVFPVETMYLNKFPTQNARDDTGRAGRQNKRVVKPTKRQAPKKAKIRRVAGSQTLQAAQAVAQPVPQPVAQPAEQPATQLSSRSLRHSRRNKT